MRGAEAGDNIEAVWLDTYSGMIMTREVKIRKYESIQENDANFVVNSEFQYGGGWQNNMLT